MKLTWLPHLSVVVVLSTLGCPKDPVCTPGAQVACACVGGAQGAQQCNEDGSALGACQCPNPSSSSSSSSGTTSGGRSSSSASSGGSSAGGSSAQASSAVSQATSTQPSSAGSTGSSQASSATGSSAASSVGGSSSVLASSAQGSSVMVSSSGVDSSSAAGTSSSSSSSSSSGSPETFSGVILLFETKVLNPGTSGTFYGQGLELNIGFSSSLTAVAPVMEEQPGSPLGCKAWQYTPAQAQLEDVGLDEGAVVLTATGTTPPSLPQCVFTAGAGYSCPFAATQSTGGTVAAGPAAGTAVLTDADVTFNTANTSGAFLTISGATNPGNNGLFPIVARAGANTIVFGNPSFVAETLPPTAVHVNLAAAGVIPAVPDPGFLSDDIALTASVQASAHYTAFTATTGTGTVADAFELQSVQTLNAVLPQAQFTVSCAATSCQAGSASGSMLTLTSTDAPTAGLSPFALPPPAVSRVVVRCLSIGTTSITVPAAYMGLLDATSPTRLESRFARVTLMGGGPATVSVMSGHAVVGYTTY